MTQPEECKPIEADDVLFRRIPNMRSANFMVTDEQSGRTRPSSGAFEPDEDGVSVYIERVLRAYDLDSNCLMDQPLQGVVALEVTDVVSGGEVALTIVSDPWPQDVEDKSHQRNAAHALIQGLGDLGKKPRRREQRRLATLADPVSEHGEE